MKRRVIIFLAAAMAFVGVTLAQTVRNEADRSGDPWWRPFNPNGQSYGVSYGLTRPTRAQGLHSGEIFVDMNGASDSGPVMEIYDGVNSTWDTVSVQSGSGGTAFRIAMWDSAGAALVDSNILQDSIGQLDFGQDNTNTFFSVGDIALATNIDAVDIDADFVAANGNDNMTGLLIGVTDSADHTGTGNFISAIRIAQATGTDADATRYGIRLAGTTGSGGAFDADVHFGALTAAAGQQGRIQATGGIRIITHELTATVAASSFDDGLLLQDTVPIIASAETFREFAIDITNANHTGGILIGADIAGITEDAQAVETALRIGAGWDYGLSILDDGSATLSNITLGDSQTTDAQLYFDGANFTIDLDGATANDFDVDLGATAIVQFEELATNNQFLLDLTNAAGAAQNVLEVQIDVINELENDTVTFFLADLNDTEFDAASGSTVNFFSIEAFTPDSHVDYNGLNIAAITGAAGTETAILISAGWDYGLTILGDGSSTTNNITLGASVTADAQIFFDGATLGFRVDGTAANDVDFILEGAAGTSTFTVRDINNVSVLRYTTNNVVNAGNDYLDVNVTSINATNGTDFINLLHLDWNEGDWATDSETLTALNIDGIVQDAAQGTYVGIYVGENWDDVLVFEGATADTEELIIRVVDPTADIIAQFRNDAAGTYNIIMHDNANLAESQLMFPNAAGMATGAAEGTDALAADTTVVCYRFFNPTPITVSEVQVISQDATSPAGSDLFGFALYEDADNGAQLCEGTGAYAADNTAVTVACAATLEPDWYRLCGGQSDVSAAIWSSIAPGAAQLLLNNDTVASEGLWTIATNSHSAADMPATTGALGATTEAMPILKLQSN